MKHILKRLFVFFIGLSLSLVASRALAQDVDSPMIYVRDFKLSTTTLIAGATVPGSATLVNDGNTDVPDVSYIATIVGDYVDGDPYTTFDTVPLGKVFMPAHSQKQVQFAYKIPIYLNGKGYGMEITAGLQSGMLLGWAEKPVTIKGSPLRNILSVNSTVLQVGSSSFYPEMGPTIHKGEAGVLEMRVTNQGSAPFKVYPQLSVFNRTTDGKVLYSSSTAPTNLVSGKETLIKQSLPDLNDKPGVYAFSLAFYDAAGNEVSRPVEGRFIIGGYIATILSANVDKQVFADGDYAQVKIVYSGTPVDIIRPVAFRGASADMIVRLYNQNDDLVSEGKQEVSLDASSATVPFTMQIHKGSHALRAEVEVQKDGKVIGSYGVKLTDSFDSLKGTPERSFSQFGYIAIALVLIVLAFALIKHRKISRHAGIAVVIIAFGFLGAGAVVSAGSFTTTHYNDSTHTLNGPDIVVNTPTEGADLIPGQAVSIGVRVSASECNNMPADLNTSVAFNGRTQSFSVKRDGVITCHETNSCHKVELAIHKTIAGYRAPAIAGNYQVGVTANTTWYRNPDYHGNSARAVVVQVIDVCPNIAGTQAAAPDGMHYDSALNKCIDTCPAGQHNDPALLYCVSDTPPSDSDVCPNIDGAQATVPNGKHLDATLNMCLINCPTGQHNDPTTHLCVNDPGSDVCSNIDGNQSVVPVGKYYDGVYQMCFDKCQAGEHNDPTTHLCVTDPSVTDVCPNMPGAQGSVPGGRHFDAPSNACVLDCTAGNHYDAATDTCVADPDLCPNLDGTQTTVPAGRHIDGPSAYCLIDCPAGQHNDEDTFQCVTDCAAGTHWDTDDAKCVANLCPADTTWDDNSQLCITSQCPAEQHSESNVCVYDDCNPGEHRDATSHKCLGDCPSGTYWDSTAQQCFPSSCPTGQHIDSTTHLCVNDGCGAGQHIDPGTGICVNDNCPDGQYWDTLRKYCVPDVHYCPDNYHWDITHGTCIPDVVCIAGTACYSDGVNKCDKHVGVVNCDTGVPICQPSDAVKTCTVCPNGTTLCRGVCVLGSTCPVKSDVTCLTPSGKILQEGQSIILYDIKKGISATDNCAFHQEKRTCIANYRYNFSGGTPTPTPSDTGTPTPTPSGSVTPTPSPTPSDTGTPSPSPSPSPSGTPAAQIFFFDSDNSGVLTGKPNPYNDLHIYERCAPFFQEV
jgi:hypothetical protein